MMTTNDTPQPIEHTPRMTGECSYGLHTHCQRHVRYDGATGWVEWLPCECACHKEQPAEPQPQTCHLCGAVVDADALAVQMAADGTPMLTHWLCRAHLVAGTERLKAAIRAERDEQPHEQEGGAS